MYEINGKYTKALVLAKTIEEKCVSQIQNICNCEVFDGCKIVIMEDTHAGKGSVIGFTCTMPKGNKVIPNIVGVDISCGMLCTKIKNDKIDYEKLDRVIRENIPSGPGGIREKTSEYISQSLKEQVKQICDKLNLNYEEQINKIGTLGGGNHFISIEEGSTGKYLIIHSGSRNLGMQVANFFQNMAKDYCENKHIEKEFSYIEGIDVEEYLLFSKICDEYAKASRRTMAYTILDKMGFEWDLDDTFTTTHNYINQEDKIIRKGAISCRLKERVLIPINMAYGSFICEGKQNVKEFNFSAPHGAGRILSRSKAKEVVSMEEYKEVMKGIWSTSVNESTKDESPMAYKDGEEIKHLIENRVDIIDHLIPLYNFKSSK